MSEKDVPWQLRPYMAAGESVSDCLAREIRQTTAAIVEIEGNPVLRSAERRKRIHGLEHHLAHLRGIVLEVNAGDAPNDGAGGDD